MLENIILQENVSFLKFLCFYLNNTINSGNFHYFILTGMFLLYILTIVSKLYFKQNKQFFKRLILEEK